MLNLYTCFCLYYYQSEDICRVHGEIPQIYRPMIIILRIIKGIEDYDGNHSIIVDAGAREDELYIYELNE